MSLQSRITFVQFALNFKKKELTTLVDFTNSTTERYGLYVNYFGYYATITTLFRGQWTLYYASLYHLALRIVSGNWRKWLIELLSEGYFQRQRGVTCLISRKCSSLATFSGLEMCLSAVALDCGRTEGHLCVAAPRHAVHRHRGGGQAITARHHRPS